MTTDPTDREALVALLDAASRVDAPVETVARARAAVDAQFAAAQGRIHALCRRYVGDPEAAGELAQETFLTAYQRIGEYEGTGSFYAWLYGIARFKCLRALVKQREALTEDGVLDPADPAIGVFQALREAERLEVLRAAAAAVLDPVEQEAVHLRYGLGLGQDRITEILGLTGATGGRGVLQRCRRKLGRELERRLRDLGHGASFFAESAP